MRNIIPIIVLFFVSFSVRAQAPDQGYEPHPKAAAVPSSLSGRVGKNPAKYLGELVVHLTKDSRDAYEAVKAIHDWIALTIAYDTDGFLGRSTPVYGYADVIKKGKSVCEGYANLFCEMCELAGIECVKISGYGRGVGFNPLQPETSFTNNHAWNAVEIDGGWCLVDVTWDAGYVSGAAFTRQYGSGYLFLSPADFIFTHFPEKSDWQLLDDPLTFKEFTRAPYLRERFFDHRLELLSDISLLQKTDEKSSIRIKTPDDIVAMASLYGAGGSELKNRTFVQRDGDIMIISTTFPSKGDYILWLFTKRLGEEGQYWGAAQFSFRAAKGTQLVFPVAFESFYTKACVIDQPLHSPLKKGAGVFFEVTVPGAGVVGVNNGSKFVNLEKNGNGKFSGTVTIEGTDVYLYYKKGNNYEYLAGWKAR
ncbi:MAG: hypothetical protein JW881_19915 [Spirochaetales bacterium]|nr:hypothetical protein [Spirochaetales bacterium]